MTIPQLPVDVYSMKKEIRQKDDEIAKLKDRINELEQAILSNCYDDPSESGKRLMTLVNYGFINKRV